MTSSRDTNPEIISARVRVNEQNTHRVHELLKQLQDRVFKQEEEIAALKGAVAVLSSELATTKQLFGYIQTQGTGNGPSVKS